MDNRQQIEQIELSMEHAKENISKMESLLTLTKNKDFQRIIEEGYFEKEASRAVLLKADPNMQDDESQKALSNQIIAIGYLRQYFTTIMQVGRMSENALEADEQTHAELLAEGV